MKSSARSSRCRRRAGGCATRCRGMGTLTLLLIVWSGTSGFVVAIGVVLVVPVVAGLVTPLG
jgi:hypothetical protein